MKAPSQPPRFARVVGQKVETLVGHGAADFVALSNPHDHMEDGKVVTQEAIGRQGHLSLPKLLIGIESDQAPEQLADTYLHEHLHVMLMMAGEDEEGLVWRLAPILLDFLRRNPKSVEYLTGRLFQ